MNKIWQGINELLHLGKTKQFTAISALKEFNSRTTEIVKDGSRIPNILNEHFATIGKTCSFCREHFAVIASL